MCIVISRETTLERQLRAIKIIEKLKGNTKKKSTQNKAGNGEQRNKNQNG